MNSLENNMEELLNVEVSDTPEGGCAKRKDQLRDCLLYTSPSPRDRTRSRMPSSA